MNGLFLSSAMEVSYSNDCKILSMQPLMTSRLFNDKHFAQLFAVVYLLGCLLHLMYRTPKKDSLKSLLNEWTRICGSLTYLFESYVIVMVNHVHHFENLLIYRFWGCVDARFESKFYHPILPNIGLSFLPVYGGGYPVMAVFTPLRVQCAFASLLCTTYIYCNW